jgi:hypothetical protein
MTDHQNQNTPKPVAGLLQPKTRNFLTDQQWVADAREVRLSDHVFVRSSAKKRTFTNVDFRYSIFDACYFRDCSFDSCDFTGCRFVGTNFHGSTFDGSKFDYASFERTQIDSSVLDVCCPPFENVKSQFARTLRVNYQGIGDVRSANKAILVELDATRTHLLDAWHGNDRYHRQKYKGWTRVKAFVDWLGFVTLDFLWGNGESPGKLARSVGLLLVGIALCDALGHGNSGLISTYWASLVAAPQLFLGTSTSPFGGFVSAGIVFLRLIAFSLFVSILVRRLVRR